MSDERAGRGRGTPLRTLAVLCPDWPLVAAGVTAELPAMVLHAGRVTALTPAARAEGLAVGLRRREAQARCPGAVVVAEDPVRDARAFEAVLVALGTLTPRMEATRAGLCSFATRGPSRFHGGDRALADRARDAARGSVRPGTAIGVGVADGPFAAALAARRSVDDDPLVLPAGASPGFLAPLPVEVLRDAGATDPAGDAELTDLVEVLGRLGLRTLGAFAALGPEAVLARFGPTGRWAHRLAAGLDPRPLVTRRPSVDLTVRAELDPPAHSIDQVTFVAKRLADELHTGLAGRGLACTRVVVTAETEHGERLERCWRHEGLLGAAAVAERVRWQLDGWLNGPPATRPTSPVTSLELAPDDLTAATGRQPGFWGGDLLADARVARAVARVGALLGDEAVRVPRRRDGRGPRVATVPATVAGEAADPTRAAGERAPWPGRLPAPSPAVVPPEPAEAEVVDARGRPVEVDARGSVSAAPVRLHVAGRVSGIVVWAGPWPLDESWWDPRTHRRCARFQVVLDDESAALVTWEARRWWVEALYE